ncbi:MAG TPA: hypothetical protein ENG03_02800 [Thioploca sp.]|nr:hypothetical protein [Thioploca sp.]
MNETPTGLRVAKTTIHPFVERIVRRNEQGADAVRIGQYVRRWLNVVGFAIAESTLRSLKNLRGFRNFEGLTLSTICRT